MKRFTRLVLSAALFLSLVVSPGLAAAETFTYDGTTPALQDVAAGGYLGSVAPSDLSNTAGNIVTVDYAGGTDPNYVFGAYSAAGDATDNTVDFKSGNVTGRFNSTLFGGSANGLASYNAVNLSGGTVTYVLGGHSRNGSANYNSVTMSGGTVTGEVAGGWVVVGDGTANHNTINFSGGSADNLTGGNSVGGEASYNIVTMTGGTVTSGVIGAWSTNGGAVTGNAVNISGGTVNGEVRGANSPTGTATGNTVSISGGTVVGPVYGGSSVSSPATGNTVNISGGRVAGNIYAGFSGGDNAINNTFDVSGNPDLSGATLWGGLGVDSVTGNILNVRTSGLGVSGVHNFQNYNFYLPATVTNGLTILDVTGAATNLTGTAVAITGIAQGGAPLHLGDTITLISGSTSAPATFSGTSVTSGLLAYDFVPVVTNDAYQAQVADAEAVPQTRSLSEGRLAAVTNLIQGQDLVAGRGLKKALGAIPDNTVDTFVALSGANNRYGTGSHIDLHGVSLLVGIGKKNAIESGTALNGFFLENGRGNYSTYDSFANLAAISAEGDSQYFGAGWLGRYQQVNGQYVEGSVRAGQVKSTFRSGDLLAATGVNADYDASTPYHGAHIGLGQEKTVNGDLTLDTYTKLLWTHQNGSTVVAAGGDPVDFEAIKSERWQLGAKLSHKVDDHTTFRTGLAYQYESGAKASASVYGCSIETPSLKGGSGIAEFGVTRKYATAAIDLSLQGFTGESKGIVGNIQASWKF